MKPSKSAVDLKKVICEAISDCEITKEEYEQILHDANADGCVDNEEKALLAQFHEMINNGTIKRVSSFKKS